MGKEAWIGQGLTKRRDFGLQRRDLPRQKAKVMLILEGQLSRRGFIAGNGRLFFCRPRRAVFFRS